MKKKKVFILILIVVVLVIGLSLLLILNKSKGQNNDDGNLENFNQTKQARSMKQSNSQREKSSTTITSTSEVKSALIESVELHATYYLEEIYVENNSYVAKGENILKYTNGTYLTAPYDCYIVELNVPESANKCLNSHYVKIQSKNMLTCSINVKEANINKISVGKEAKITISALEKTYTGYITHIASTASNGNFTVDIEFANDGDVKLGMTSNIELNV